MIDSIAQDFRHAIRSLRRMRGTAILIVATLAVVIAATTTIFAVADALLLRPVAGRDPHRLVRVYANRSSNPWYRDYIAFRDRATTLDLAAFDDQRVSVGAGADAQAAFAELVSANYFDVIGLRAARGRMLAAADGEPAGTPVAVLSDRYWHSRFGADPEAIGSTLTVNGAKVAVVGVAPASFTGAYGMYAVDLWIPITLDPLLRPGAVSLLDPERPRGVQIVGRLRDGARLDQARTELAGIAAEQAAMFPGPLSERTASVHEARLLPPDFTNAVALFFAILMAIAGVLLLAACANVANVLLARATGQRRDMALRQAIGASRRRLVQQQLVEGLAVSFVAAAAAVTLTWWTMQLLTASPLPTTLPLALSFSVDERVLLFACALAVATTVLCALAPALQGTRGHLLPALRAGEASISTHSRLRSAFVVAQVTASVLLLVVAGLFVRSLGRVNTIDLGMDTRNVLLVALDTETRGYTPERAQQFYRELLERIRATPGVVAASLADIVPLSLNDRGARLPGPDPASPSARVSYNTVSPGTLATLGIRLIAGRDFDERDTARSRRVAIINEALAREWFGSRSAVGQRMRGPAAPGEPPVDLEVIGVAGNAAYQRIGEEQAFFAYFPLAQMFSPAPTLMVRTAGDPTAMTASVRAVLAGLDTGLPVFGVQTLESSAQVTLLPARLAAAVSGTLGALVLVLAAIGLYGVVSFMVRQRRREIGVRMALGASAQGVAGLFLQQYARWMFLGLAIGLVLAAAVTRVISSFLFGISPLDAPTFIGAIALMLTVTSAASYLPARRAARINPVEALRAE